MADGIRITQTGDFSKTFDFLRRAQKYVEQFVRRLDYYGKMGVDALVAGTPKDTGLTANSWNYRVVNPSKGFYRLEWYNTNINNGVSIALIIQYGHATGNGVYIRGIDYINPAIRPVFEKIAANCWKEVNAA